MSTSLGAAIRGPSRRKRGGMAVVSGPRFPPGWPLVIGLASTAAQDSISAPKSRRLWPGAVSSFCGVVLALRCEVNRAGAADGIGQRPRRHGDCSADPSVPCLPLAFGCALLSCRHDTRAAAVALGAGLASVAAGSVIGGAPRAVPDLAVTVVAIGGGVALGWALSLKPRVMAILLALWSIADIALNALISGRVSRADRALPYPLGRPMPCSGFRFRGPLRHRAPGPAPVHRRR
jgi:hypothetical protein